MARSGLHFRTSRIAGLLAVAATAAFLASCSSMGGVSSDRFAASSAAVPLQPAALVESAPIQVVPPRAPAVTATAVAVRNSAAVPNLGVAPAASESRVLNPDEKARVVAELEALARRQGEETAKARAALGACSLDGLSTAERVKRVAAGAKC